MLKCSTTFQMESLWECLTAMLVGSQGKRKKKEEEAVIDVTVKSFSENTVNVGRQMSVPLQEHASV